MSTLSDQTIAGKIASTLNRHTCHGCSRPVEGGVFAFGLSGSDPRWYPTEEDARQATPGVRYIHPHTGQDISRDEILDWLRAQRDELEQLLAAIETNRYHRRQEQEVRRAERNAERGCKTGSYPCEDCAKNGIRHLKRRPADECDRCGDIPVPLGISDEDYNRARGYAY